ncbi:hypothetical protein [Magnetococcus sp. PR-3]|uniref:hypothetical protein n=1 Tax=Magnetococcus sp. PR-3 TaxID=3120355 RepID=UPI002FCDF7E1
MSGNSEGSTFGGLWDTVKEGWGYWIDWEDAKWKRENQTGMETNAPVAAPAPAQATPTSTSSLSKYQQYMVWIALAGVAFTALTLFWRK